MGVYSSDFFQDQCVCHALGLGVGREGQRRGFLIRM